MHVSQHACNTRFFGRALFCQVIIVIATIMGAFDILHFMQQAGIPHISDPNDASTQLMKYVFTPNHIQLIGTTMQVKCMPFFTCLLH